MIQLMKPYKAAHHISAEAGHDIFVEPVELCGDYVTFCLMAAEEIGERKIKLTCTKNMLSAPICEFKKNFRLFDESSDDLEALRRCN